MLYDERKGGAWCALLQGGGGFGFALRTRRHAVGKTVRGDHAPFVRPWPGTGEPFIGTTERDLPLEGQFPHARPLRGTLRQIPYNVLPINSHLVATSGVSRRHVERRQAIEIALFLWRQGPFLFLTRKRNGPCPRRGDLPYQGGPCPRREAASGRMPDLCWVRTPNTPGGHRPPL